METASARLWKRWDEGPGHSGAEAETTCEIASGVVNLELGVLHYGGLAFGYGCVVESEVV